MLIWVLLLTACGAGAPPAPIPSPTPSWQEFKPEDAGFAILMPAPAQSEEETRDTLFGQIMLNRHAAKFDNMVFGAAYSSLPADFIAAYPAEQILKAMQEGGLRYYSGRLLSSKVIKLGDYPGIDVTLEVPDNKRTPGGGVLRARLYLIGNVIYEIDHLGSKRQSISPDIKKFMDSFQLTGETPIMTPAPIVAGEWQEFQSPDGNFRILMPREPLKDFVPLGGDFGPIELNMFETQLGNMEYAVGYVDLPPDKLKQYKTATLLSNMSQHAASAPNGRILSSKAIKLGSYPGHEIIADGVSSTDSSEKKVLRMRLYLVGNRLYEVLQAAPKSQSQLPDIQKFFDSFTLLKK
jgi:hypothetical protein